MLPRICVPFAILYHVVAPRPIVNYPADDPLFISAFNVRVFGKVKMSKIHVVRILVEIIQRYDIIVIQEIRDVNELAFPNLLRKVQETAGPCKRYGALLSPRSGRTFSKEQYGFIYRRDRVKPVLEYEFHDRHDVFERDPYIVEFENLTSGKQKKFNVITLHAKPNDAVEEMNGLIRVYEDAIIKSGHSDSIIIGDLNADCSYVCRSCWSTVRLRHDPRFHWMIEDNADTTVISTHCAYDRIIATGAMVETARKASVFRFDDEYDLTLQQAKNVSDHYPVDLLVY